MRYNEILNEYSQAKTGHNYGPKLIGAMLKDNSLPEDLARVAEQLKTNPNDDNLKAAAVSALLAQFELMDPTQHKEYVQWLAKCYAGGSDRLSDVANTAREYLNVYHIGKRRGKLDAKNADINKFKSYNDFEFMMMCQDHKMLTTKPEVNKGKAKTLYDSPNARVIAIYDEAAAIYYGQGSAWCTAYTDPSTPNHFSFHNSKGQLYIILPKQPEYEGEKFMFTIAQAMLSDETNEDVRIDWFFETRFPELLNVFKQLEPDAKVWASDWFSPNNPGRHNRYVFDKKMH